MSLQNCLERARGKCRPASLPSMLVISKLFGLLRLYLATSAEHVLLIVVGSKALGENQAPFSGEYISNFVAGGGGKISII